MLWRGWSNFNFQGFESSLATAGNRWNFFVKNCSMLWCSWFNFDPMFEGLNPAAANIRRKYVCKNLPNATAQLSQSWYYVWGFEASRCLHWVKKVLYKFAPCSGTIDSMLIQCLRVWIQSLIALDEKVFLNLLNAVVQLIQYWSYVWGFESSRC